MKALMIVMTLIFSQISVYSSVSSDLKVRLKNFEDPFKRKFDTKKGKGSSGKKAKTFFTNKFDVTSVLIENIKIIGIYLGKERRAIGVELARSAQPFVIKEGMKIGPDGVEVKAILPGGIVLVEKITNVYDEVEYLETIIPISEE
jgi:hypothetical protein